MVDKPPSNPDPTGLGLTASTSERFPGGAKPIVEQSFGDDPADLPISRFDGCCLPCASQEGRPSMDRPIAAETGATPATDEGEPEAIDFVRFCYRRRRVGWPELYDEMCAVAGRGLYHGYTVDYLGGIGVGLTLFELPALAAVVHRVVAEDQERRQRTAHAIRVAHAERVEASATTEAADAHSTPSIAVAGESVTADSSPTEQQPRFVPVVATA